MPHWNSIRLQRWNRLLPCKRCDGCRHCPLEPLWIATAPQRWHDFSGMHCPDWRYWCCRRSVERIAGSWCSRPLATTTGSKQRLVLVGCIWQWSLSMAVASHVYPHGRLSPVAQSNLDLERAECRISRPRHRIWYCCCGYLCGCWWSIWQPLRTIFCFTEDCKK